MAADFTECPYVCCQDPELFNYYLRQLQTAPTRLLKCSDSTGMDVVGSGDEPNNWWRWLANLDFGHSPASVLSLGTDFGGAVPGASWLIQGNNNAEAGPKMSDLYLPPGYNTAVGAGFSFRLGNTGDGGGLFIFLNHRNDNNVSMSGAGTHGYQWSAGGQTSTTEDATIGSAAFHSGTMQGTRSLIDCSEIGGGLTKLRIELLAAAYPGSVADVRVRGMSQTAAEFTTANLFGEYLSGGPYTLLGGNSSLNAALGTAFRVQTPNLPVLSGTARFYGGECAGNTIDPNLAAQIIGARFITDNPLGLIMDSFSQGGIHGTSATMISEHGNCFGIVEAGGYKIAILSHGHNDNAYSKNEFKANEQANIERLSNAGVVGFILDAQPAQGSEGSNHPKFAAAYYEIALEDHRCIFLNTRRLTTDLGWTPATHTTDGTHPNALGAQMMARASYGLLMQAISRARGSVVGVFSMTRTAKRVSV